MICHIASARPMRFAGAILLSASLLLPSPRSFAQVSTVVSPEVHARGDIAGDWQGTLAAGKSLRILLRITKTDRGFAAKFYSIDQGSTAIAVNSVSVDGSAVKFGVDLIGGSYNGAISADGTSIAGTWTQGPNDLPLTLVRANKETAWEIPAPPPPPKMMAADADPAFEVATIKPNDSGATTMQQLTINGRDFKTRASSLADLIAFAYAVQTKQIVAAPDWITRDRYDIAAVPDTPGAPSPTQLRGMIRKLLADRFKLTFHKDTREMSAFVLTVARGGQKLTPTQASGPLPGLGFGPGKGGLNLIARNASLGDLSELLQSLVLDRPVVNQTGVDGRFDLTVNFSADDSQFNGHPPHLPKTDSVEPAPSLFDALQQQVGLKLEAQKASVMVLAIDHVEKPTAN